MMGSALIFDKILFNTLNVDFQLTAKRFDKAVVGKR